MSALINEYANSVKNQFLTGHAKEHAYRPALERLMSSFEDVVAVNDPKRSAHGNPDFVFLKQSHQAIILGYAEAKDIGISLDKTEKTNQMTRYGGYENLFLTDYLEFRFFQNGNKYQTISIGEIKNGELLLNTEAFAQLQDELANFLELPPETIKSGKRLAQIMGAKARRIRDNVAIYLKHEDNEQNQQLEKIYNLMKELLVHDLSPDKFADMYAQTLVYGLFVARYGDTSPENFTRSEARDLIPASNPFLREFFDHIAGTSFDKRLGYIVDELCEVFSVSNVHDLVQKHLRLFEVDNEKDPIIHFYEDFLKEYDPDERKKMGAYYTPIPVVRFIIQQVDKILKSEFDLPKGIADSSKRPIVVKSQGIKQKVEVHRVQVLDPAVGTATFLNETIKYIHEGFKGQEGRWSSYARQDLLPRLYGFELMMAPYTIAHLKLSMTLQDTGVKDLTQRLGVYLTNTLEEGIKHQQDLFSIGLADVVTQESQKATEIKHDRPIMVIIGNPPYSVSSNNKSDYINKLVSDYKTGINDRNIQPLSDDYIKFIRFAEEMVLKNSEGIIGMITNNSFIDGTIHRQMRKHLMESFDSIYVLDLHGSTKKRETTSDGGKDQNVFDIQQGVSINIFVKKSNSKKNATLYHSELLGLKKDKFSKLSSGIDWNIIEPKAPNHFFKPTDDSGIKQYDKYIALTDLFIMHNAGSATGKDATFVGLDKADLESSLKNADIEYDPAEITDYLYRPFDSRKILYDTTKIQRLRHGLMKHMRKENLALLTCKKQTSFNFQHAFITNQVSDRCSVSLQTGEVGYLFPLYLYHDDGTRSVNFHEKPLSVFSKNLTTSPEPENVMDYIYAILHSPMYRKKFNGLLRYDFPKIPAPKNNSYFNKLTQLGRELRELHLMKTPNINDYSSTYGIEGSDAVERLSYSDGKVYINEEQYFGNIPEEAWNFYIGGYQPAQKWLKDRKGKTLSNDDIEHYQRVITILKQTSQIMLRIDESWEP